uniref:Uncharacterized protein n=1 Tax=Lepeophtheirus salmonis TaxID=72036 RepID=A0A0K2UAP6_LEPSM
MCIYLLMSNK